ncbi:MAG: C25 family cysteine peptidase, partial [Chloroflexia bacterium]
EGERFSRLYGDGYGHGTQVGYPDLPVLRKEVEIPFGAQVTVELLRADYRDVRLEELGLYPIYPLQPPQLKTPAGESETPFQIDRPFYSQGSLFPAFPLALGEPYIVRGHRVQPVEVWPVAYDPSAGILRLYREIVFRLLLDGSDMARTEALAERYASPAFEARLAQRILNYNQGRPPRRFGPETPIGYLIITADAFYDAMVPFVQLRESRGFDVTMMRCSQIGGCLSASNVQAYIVNAYHNWPLPPSYVLLVGDTDSIATWTGPVINTSTDLYYGTMDGAGDWHPDIGRGRFPVRTVAHATAMVDKYLAYAQLTGQEPWLKKASFPATCDGSNYPIAEGTHNYVINTHTAPNGYWGRFPNDPQPGGDKLYCITYGATHDNLVQAFNDGRWAIIYSGHGSYTGWEMNFTPTDVQNLTNYGMFPFVASHACLSGNFGQPEVFGETWVLQPNKGALVYWGSSTYSYWDEDDVLERAMFDSLFAPGTPHANVAEMTDEGLAAVEAAYPSSARYYWETYNVLGDPAVKIFLEPDLPTFTLQVDPSSLEVCDAGTVTASVIIGSLLGYSETVYLETGPLPAGVTASFEPPYAQAPFTSTLSLAVAPDTPAGNYTIVVTATDQISWTLSEELTLRVSDGAPQAPLLLSPPDGATDQPYQPTFEWEPLASATSYRLQVDPSALFPAPVIDVAGLAEATYTPETPLEDGRCYWWRAGGDNGCGEGAWASPFHFATVALTTVFFDDIESGPGQWSHSAAQGTDHWQISTAQSHSPTHSWFVPDDAVVTDSRLWNTTPVLLGTDSTLTFWHRYQFEGTAYDGAVLEISTNGGSSWQDLGPYITANGYNGTISTCCSNPLGGRQAWVGDLTTWTQVTVDLSAFAGQQAQIRWRIGCDFSVSDVGWYIDDVQITAQLPPNPPATLARIEPNIGTPFEPTPVTIEGSGFAGQPSARLGETWLLSLTLASSTTLEAVVPAGMEPGVYTLTLYNGDTCGESTLSNAFTVTFGCTPTVFLASDSPVAWGEPVHLAATVYGTPPFTYTWDM